VTNIEQQTEYSPTAKQKAHSLEIIAPCARKRNDYVRRPQINHSVLVISELP